MNREQQRHRKHIWGGSPVKDKSQEGEIKDSEWTMKEAVLWQTQTFDLENGTICFCLAPVYHMSVLRLRREKLHELSPKTWSPLDWKKKEREKFPGMSSITQTSMTLDLVSLNLRFSAHRSFLRLAKLTWISTCRFSITPLLKNPAVKHSKALRKPDYINTSLPKTTCSLACSG